MTLTLATPGTATVAHTLMPKALRPQLVEDEVVDTTAVAVGAVVTAEPPPRTLPPAVTLATPPLLGRTPALRVTVARLPKPRVAQTFKRAPLHDADTAVMVLSFSTILVGTTCPLVSEGRTVALTPALMSAPLEGRASAPIVMVPAGPNPSEIHASRTPPTPQD